MLKTSAFFFKFYLESEILRGSRRVVCSSSVLSLVAVGLSDSLMPRALWAEIAPSQYRGFGDTAADAKLVPDIRGHRLWVFAVHHKL